MASNPGLQDLIARLATGFMPAGLPGAAPAPYGGPGMASGTMIPPPAPIPLPQPVGADGGVGGMAAGTTIPDLINRLGPGVAPGTVMQQPDPNPVKAMANMEADIYKRLGDEPDQPGVPDENDDYLTMQRRINAGEFDPPKQVPAGDPLIQNASEIDPAYIAARQQRDFRLKLAERLANQNATLDQAIAQGRSPNPIPAGLRGPDDLAGRMAKLPDEVDQPNVPDEAEVNAARAASAGIDAMPKTFQPTSGDSPVAQIEIGSPEYQQYLDAQRARIATGMNRPEMRAAGIADTPVHLTNAANTRRRSPGAEQKLVMAEAQRRTKQRRDQADTDRAARNEAAARQQFLAQTGAAGLEAVNQPGMKAQEMAQKDKELAAVKEAKQREQALAEKTQADKAAADKADSLIKGRALLMEGMQRGGAASAKAKADAEERRLRDAEIKLKEGALAKSRDENLPPPASPKDQLEMDTFKEERAKAKLSELITRLQGMGMPAIRAESVAKLDDSRRAKAEKDFLAEQAAKEIQANGNGWILGSNSLRRADDNMRSRLRALGFSPEEADAYASQYFPTSRMIPGMPYPAESL